MSEHVDVKFKSWGNGSTSGPWVKFDLENDEALEALKSEAGKEFHMILVPVSSDEKPGQVYETAGDKPKPKIRLSNEAFFMLKEDNFRKFLEHLYPGDFSTIELRDEWLKKTINIKSKRELDEGNDLAIGCFIDLRDVFRRWANEYEG